MSRSELLVWTRNSAPLRSCAAGIRDDPRPRPRGGGGVCMVDERSDGGGSCGFKGGPGVKFMIGALASTILEVTLSGRRNDVFRVDAKRAVRRRSAIPCEKSGRKPAQSASEPAALRRNSGLRSAFWCIRMLRTIRNCDESWSPLWWVLISLASSIVSGAVEGFKCKLNSLSPSPSFNEP